MYATIGRKLFGGDQYDIGVAGCFGCRPDAHFLSILGRPLELLLTGRIAVPSWRAINTGQGCRHPFAQRPAARTLHSRTGWMPRKPISKSPERLLFSRVNQLVPLAEMRQEWLQGVAKENGLKLDQGRIHLPDVQTEYLTQDRKTSNCSLVTIAKPESAAKPARVSVCVPGLARAVASDVRCRTAA